MPLHPLLSSVLIFHHPLSKLNLFISASGSKGQVGGMTVAFAAALVCYRIFVSKSWNFPPPIPKKKPSNWLRELKKRKKIPSLKLKVEADNSKILWSQIYPLCGSWGPKWRPHTQCHIFCPIICSNYVHMPNVLFTTKYSVFSLFLIPDMKPMYVSTFSASHCLTPNHVYLLRFLFSHQSAEPKSGGTLLFFDRVWVSHHRQHCCFSE